MTKGKTRRKKAMENLKSLAKANEELVSKYRAGSKTNSTSLGQWQQDQNKPIKQGMTKQKLSESLSEYKEKYVEWPLEKRAFSPPRRTTTSTTALPSESEWISESTQAYPQHEHVVPERAQQVHRRAPSNFAWPGCNDEAANNDRSEYKAKYPEWPLQETATLKPPTSCNPLQLNPTSSSDWETEYAAKMKSPPVSPTRRAVKVAPPSLMPNLAWEPSLSDRRMSESREKFVQWPVSMHAPSPSRPHTNPLNPAFPDAAMWCSETSAAQHALDTHSSDPIAGISSGEHPQLPVNFAWKASDPVQESEQHESYRAWPVTPVEHRKASLERTNPLSVSSEPTAYVSEMKRHLCTVTDDSAVAGIQTGAARGGTLSTSTLAWPQSNAENRDASEYKQNFVQWPVQREAPCKPAQHASPIPTCADDTTENSGTTPKYYHDATMRCAGVTSGRSGGINFNMENGDVHHESEYHTSFQKWPINSTIVTHVPSPTNPLNISTEDIAAWNHDNASTSVDVTKPRCDAVAGAATGMLEHLSKPTQIIWKSDSGETTDESEYRRSYTELPSAKTTIAKPPVNDNPIAREVIDVATWQSEAQYQQQQQQQSLASATDDYPAAGIPTKVKGVAPRNFAWQAEPSGAYLSSSHDDYQPYATERPVAVKPPTTTNPFGIDLQDTDISRWTQPIPPTSPATAPAGIDTGLTTARNAILPPNFAWNGSMSTDAASEAKDKYVQWSVVKEAPRLPPKSESPIATSSNNTQWLSEYQSAQLSLQEAIATMKKLVGHEDTAGVRTTATSAAPINFAWNNGASTYASEYADQFHPQPISKSERAPRASSNNPLNPTAEPICYESELASSMKQSTAAGSSPVAGIVSGVHSRSAMPPNFAWTNGLFAGESEYHEQFRKWETTPIPVSSPPARSQPYASFPDDISPSSWRSEYQATQQNLMESMAKLKSMYTAGKASAMPQPAPTNFAWAAEPGVNTSTEAKDKYQQWPVAREVRHTPVGTMNILNASLDAVDPQQWTTELSTPLCRTDSPANIAGKPSERPPAAPINFSWTSQALEGSSEYKSSYRPWAVEVVKPAVRHSDSITCDVVNGVHPSQWKSEYQANMLGRTSAACRGAISKVLDSAPKPTSAGSSSSSDDASISCNVVAGTTAESSSTDSDVSPPPSPPQFTVKDDVVTPSKPLSVSQFKQLSASSTEYRDQYTAKMAPLHNSTTTRPSTAPPKTEHQMRYLWPTKTVAQQSEEGTVTSTPSVAMMATAMTTDSLEATKPAVKSPNAKDTCQSNKPQRPSWHATDDINVRSNVDRIGLRDDPSVSLRRHSLTPCRRRGAKPVARSILPNPILMNKRYPSASDKIVGRWSTETSRSYQRPVC